MVVHRSRQILIIHPGALGDVLQAIPALAALGELGEGSHLTFAGQTRLGRLLSGVGLVDEAIPFDGLGLENLFAHGSLPPQVESRLARFDRVISWFGARAEPFPQRLHSVVPAALIAPPIPETGPPPTVWEHLVRTLAPWGVTAPTRPAVLSLPRAWRAEARRALSRLSADDRRPLLVVHPGAGALWKQWPTESLARVIRRVALESGCQVLVHQGPADRDAVEGLFRALDQPMLHLVGPPLHLLAAVLQEASAYLGGDSGVSHLAASVGARAVILFSSPSVRERWAPWSPTALPLAVSNGLHEK
jgi:ADP-heptose:LPS heptosyltransferase